MHLAVLLCLLLRRRGCPALKVPPYPFPLDQALNKRDWWNHHRPLILETSSLGPIDTLQRQPTPRVPFQGFRVVQVRANLIEQIHYVTLKEIVKPG